MESDSLSIIIKINTSNIPRNEAGIFIEDIVNLSKDFPYCSFHFVKSDGNRATHVLAKLNPYEVGDRIGIEKDPSKMHDVLMIFRE